MLTAIEEMKYFLRTAYGDSKEFAGSTIEVKYQGLCQGNGAAPAGWAVISITIIGAHKRKGHGGYFVCPISNLEGQLAAILFVDDTDLIHIRMDRNESVEEAHAALQSSIISWGNLLISPRVEPLSQSSASTISCPSRGGRMAPGNIMRMKLMRILPSACQCQTIP